MEEYTRNAVALKRKVNIQAMGCAALERPPYMGGLRLSCRLLFAVAAIGIL
jgi:hypothetical protein